MIYNELLKHGETKLSCWLQTLFNNILTTKKMPTEWKQEERKQPENDRGISLMNTTLKLLQQKTKNKINMAEEQQGFWKNRSTVDTTFIIRQLAGKSTENNKQAYLCYVDLKNAFDRTRSIDILKIILRPRNLPQYNGISKKN